MDEWKILVCVVCLDGVVGEPLGVNDNKNTYFLQTSTLLAAKLNSR